MVTILLVDVIFNYSAAAIILLCAICIYALLVSRVLPKVLLSPIVGENIHDRGIRKCKFNGERAVVYEPRLTVRKYVNQYVLYTEKGRKYIKCKLDRRVENVKYELVVYDRKDNPIDVLQISQTPGEGGYTPAVLLPSETSYVNFQLGSVNKADLSEKDVDIYDVKRAFLFFIVVFALTISIGLLANYVIMGFVDMLLGYLKAVPHPDHRLPLAVMAGISALTAFLALSLNLARPHKFAWKSAKKNPKNRKSSRS